MQLIEKIKSSGYCTGCGLCASITQSNSIYMDFNASGYLRPMQNNPLTDFDENHIKQVCPGISLSHKSDEVESHTIWGPLLKSRTGYSTDKFVRNQGSSGGVISALAIYLLESKTVDFIAQIAVSSTDPLKNIQQISRNKQDVIHAAGSRYAPSAPLENLMHLFKTNEKFAFIGKPCDVAALRQFLNYNPQYKHQVKYLISFMCAGIPSIHATDKVLKKMGADKSKLISFRYRGDGWPGMAKAIQNDGQSFEMNYNSSWGEVLGRELQFRCKLCPDGTGEFADIVCADAWYGKDGYPDFAESDGRSMILTRTQDGEALVNAAFHANAINMTLLEVDEIAKMQPYQVTRKQVILGRVIAAGIVNRQFVSFRKLNLLKASLTIHPLVWLRHAWGTFKRTKVEVQ